MRNTPESGVERIKREKEQKKSYSRKVESKECIYIYKKREESLIQKEK